MDYATPSALPGTASAELSPRRQFWRGVRGILWSLLWLLSLYVVTVLGMWGSWDQSDWTFFWTILTLYVIFSPLLLLIPIALRNGNQKTPTNPLLRYVLANADDYTAPIASNQPLPSENTELGADAAEMYFDNLFGQTSLQNHFGCLIAFFVPIGLVFFVIFIINAENFTFLNILLAFVVFFLFLLIWSISLLISL